MILATLGIILLVGWMSLWEMLAIRAVAGTDRPQGVTNAFEVAPF